MFFSWFGTKKIIVEPHSPFGIYWNDLERLGMIWSVFCYQFCYHFLQPVTTFHPMNDLWLC